MNRPAVDRGNKKSSFGTRARTGILDKRSLLFVLYAVYIAFILVSTVPYIAEHQTRYEKIGDDHTYHIVFEEDGDDAAHYFDVVRANKTQPGVLGLTYNPSSHTLEVDAKNIVELRLESESIYKDEAEVILGTNYDNDPDFYKQWFIEKDKFTVNVNSDTEIAKLVFENVPKPTRVLVDNEEWWKTNLNYQLTNDDVEVTKVPKGATTVVIYFQQIVGKNPIAMFTASKYIATWNEDILFDASGSTDEDGNIEHYLWDFGDASEGSGLTIDHSFSIIGNYSVILTVRDNDYLEDTYSKTITVVQSGLDSDNDGVADVLDPNPYSALDTDNDGLSDDFELVISKTNLTRKDTDGDGWDDKSEWDENTDPNSPTSHPTEPEPEEEDEGIFGMGIMGGILILLIIVIIIVIIMIVIIKKRKDVGEKPEVEPAEPLKPLEPAEKIRPVVVEAPVKIKVPSEDLSELNESEEQELVELEQQFGGKRKGARPVSEEPEFECPECGMGVNDEDTVCPKCGLKFE